MIVGPTDEDPATDSRGRRGLLDVLCWITGARREELGSVLGCFLALFFLLISYYFVKPLRNSQFLKEFSPLMLPWFYLAVSLLSLILTKVFNFFFERFSRRVLIVGVFSTMMLCKVGFAVWLPNGGKLATTVFYLWGSVYFLLVLAALWACINDTFQPEQGERCYGFISLGATLGTILGSHLSLQIARQAQLRQYALLISAAAMGAAMGLIVMTYRKARPDCEDQPHRGTRGNFWEDVRVLWTDRYLRSIAVTVIALALFNSSAEFLTQKVIDRRVSETQFSRAFSALPQSDFEFVYGLKSIKTSERSQRISEYAAAHGLGVEQFKAAYGNYKNEVESHIRALYSDIFQYQGMLGMLLLVFASRWLFKVAGLRFSVSILPTFALLGLIALSFPLSLLVVQIFLVCSGSLNYSLNNAAKELLYTATSTDVKFQQKPLIEGPCMRLGDGLASSVNLSVPYLALATGLGSGLSEHIFVLFALAWVIWWLRSASYAGGLYDARRCLAQDP